MPKYTTETKQAAVDLYLTGASLEQVAAKLGLNSKSVWNWVTQAGQSTRQRTEYTHTDKQACVALYKSGLSQRETARKLGVTTTTVSKWLASAGVNLRSAKQNLRKYYNYTTDESCFDDLSKEEQQYWLGFLAADGCVVGNTIRLVLKQTDNGHILAFKNYTKTNSSVRFVRQTNGVGVSVFSSKLVQVLKMHGITERKSLTLKISPELQSSRHYWRGVVDGDGHVSCKRYAVLQLVGSYEHMNQFMAFAKRHTSSKVKLRKVGNVYSAHFTAGPAQDLVRELYAGSQVHLQRKKQASLALLIRYDKPSCEQRT